MGVPEACALCGACGTGAVEGAEDFLPNMFLRKLNMKPVCGRKMRRAAIMPQGNLHGAKITFGRKIQPLDCLNGLSRA
jgi:hypothetical protein